MGRWSNLTDVVENENGTYTAIGLLYTNTGNGPQNGFIQDTYLITVDSLGCIVEGCDVGVFEFETLENLFVYPNPARDVINIGFPQEDDWSIVIYDAMGRVVMKEYERHTKTISLRDNNIRTGLYFIKATNSTGEQLVSSLLKE